MCSIDLKGRTSASSHSVLVPHRYEPLGPCAPKPWSIQTVMLEVLSHLQLSGPGGRDPAPLTFFFVTTDTVYGPLPEDLRSDYRLPPFLRNPSQSVLCSCLELV